MSDDDVHCHEMNEPPDFDDTAAESLLSGANRDVDPDLADLLGDMRVAYTSQSPAVGPALAALIGTTEPASAPRRRRFERMHTSILAKIATATATAVFATGGLAAAHALPARMQDAVSHLGVGRPAHHSSDTQATQTDESTTTIDPTATTMPDTTPTTVEASDNNGDTTTTLADGTTPTTVESSHDGAFNDNNGANCDSQHGQDAKDGQEETDATTVPTTTPPSVSCTPTTDTTVPQSSDGHGDGSHDSQDGNGDSNSTVTPMPTNDHSGASDSTSSDSNSNSGSAGSGDSGGSSNSNSGDNGGASNSTGGN